MKLYGNNAFPNAKVLGRNPAKSGLRCWTADRERQKDRGTLLDANPTTTQSQGGFHPYRIAGCHRDHRDSGRAVAAGFVTSPGTVSYTHLTLPTSDLV